MQIALPPAIAPAAFADRQPGAAVATLDGRTMGTTWRVKLVVPSAFDRAGIERAIAARLDGLLGEMSHWEPDSLLSRFNRGRGWFALPPNFAQVIGEALAIAEASAGAFDPAIGRVVDLWGYGPPGPMPPPSAAALEEARADSGWRRLAFDLPGSSARLYQPGGVSLDLSGIAKGHAVDAVADLLAAHGVRHCLVEIGGELVGRGVRPDGEPWWVDLEDPPGAELEPFRVALHGLAVATSGNYLRGAHTIDPRTGRPVANDVASVSVVGGTALHADAWATAMTVLGPEEGIAVAARFGIAARIVSTFEGRADERMSPALAAMLED